MSHDYRLRAVKLPSFKVTSKKQASSPSAGPPVCVSGGSMARHAGQLAPIMDFDQIAHSLDSGSRDTIDRQHPVAHRSRSRSVRENPTSGGLSGVQEQQPCPPFEQRGEPRSKPSPDFNCQALISWIEAHQQSYSEALQQLSGAPLVKEGDGERGQSSFLKKMKSCNSSQNSNTIENVDNKMPVSVGARSPGVTQFKQRAKSEPARSRHESKHKQDARCPDQGSRSRDKNSRAASEHRRCEPSIVHTPTSVDSQPLPSTAELALPQHLAAFDIIEKNYTMHRAKCGESHKRKGKSKKTKSKNIQSQQPIIEEQVSIEDAGSKNRNNKESQQQRPCDYHSFLQKRKTGFRFGNVMKKSSRPRVLPTIREDPLDRPPKETPLDRPPKEDKTATNQQSGDEAPVPKKKSKKTEEPNESTARTERRECPEPEAGNSQDVPAPASDAPTCTCETKPRRRKSTNLCPKKKQPSGSRRQQAAGGNLFQSFADAVGSQLSSIAWGNQRFYFPGMRHLYTPDVDLGSLYQPYDDCDEDGDHTGEMRSPHRDRSRSPEKEAEEDRHSKSGSSQRRSIQSKSPLSDRETDNESVPDVSPESPRGDIIIESSISISSAGSDGRSSRRKAPLSSVAASDAAVSRKGSKRRHTSITSSIRASAKSDRSSKKSSVPDGGSSKSLARSRKESSLRSDKPGASETRKSKTPSAESQKRSSTKKSSIASSEWLDDDKRKTSGRSGRETPLPKGSYERSSKDKKVKKRTSPSSKGESSLEDVPESDSETSTESDLSVTSQEKHSPTIKHSKLESPTSQQKRSKEVYESENGHIHIEMDRSVSLVKDRKSNESTTSTKSSVSSRSPKGSNQIDHSPGADLASKQPSKPSSVLTHQTGESKQSSGILRSGKKTPDSGRDMLPGAQQFDSQDTIKLSERITPTTRSSKTPSHDSPHSFAPSERQKSLESGQSLASRGPGSSLVPEESRQPATRSDRSQELESVPSLARSERSQQPESVASLARSERSQQLESVQSLARSERSQQPESVPSLARSERSQQLESVQSLARSERSQQPESVQSLARSERSQQPESVQSLARSERSQQPESVQSLARSERSQQPESVPSLAWPEWSQQLESVQSLARSERSQQPESVQSLARSERSQQLESVPSLARSERSQQPESVQSLARSDRMQTPEITLSVAPSERRTHEEITHSQTRSDLMKTPESMHSERTPPIENIYSAIKYERTTPYDSKISVAVSEAVSRASKATSRNSYWSAEGKQSVILSDGTYVIDAMQTIIVSDSASSSEHSSSETPHMVMESPNDSKSRLESTYTDKEVSEDVGRQDDKQSVHSVEWTTQAETFVPITASETPASRHSAASGRLQEVQASSPSAASERLQETPASTYSMESERLQEIPASRQSAASERLQEMPTSRQSMASERLKEMPAFLQCTESERLQEILASTYSMAPERQQGMLASRHSMASERLQEMPTSRQSPASVRLQEMPTSRQSMASERLQEMPAFRQSADSERLQEILASRHSMASERLQEMSASMRSLATSDRPRGSYRETTATSSNVGSKRPSADWEDLETLIRRSDIGSKQSYRSAEMTPKTHTASRTSAEMTPKTRTASRTSAETPYEMPAYRQSTVSERTLQGVPDLLSSPSKRTPRSPYIDTEKDEVLFQRSLPGSKVSFGSDEITERESTSERRKPGRLSYEQIYTEEQQSSSPSEDQQSTDARQVSSSPQMIRPSEKDSRYKPVDFLTRGKPSMIYSDGKRLTPAGIEHTLSPEDQMRDYKQVFKRHTSEMDASGRIRSETQDVGRREQDVGRREKRKMRRHGCRCADCVPKLKIIMKDDSSDDARCACSCIQVCSCLRRKASCLVLKAMDCKKESPSPEHTESETEEESSGCSKLSDRAHGTYQQRKVGHQTHKGDKRSGSTGSNYKPRCPCESILDGYSTGVGRPAPRERRSPHQAANPASAKERRSAHCDTSTGEMSTSSRLSASRTASKQFSRSSHSSKSTSGQQRRGEGSGSDKTCKQDDTVYGDFDQDDFLATSSEKQSRYETNDEWEDSSPKQADGNTTEFDTSQEAYNRWLRKNGRRSTRRTAAALKHSSPHAKPSRENIQQRTAVQDRVAGKYQQKLGSNYVRVTSSNLSTSSKSDCSSLQITLRSCKDGERRLHKDHKPAHMDGARGYKKPSAPAMTTRYRSDYQADAEEMRPSRKEGRNGDCYSTERQSGSRQLAQTDMEVSRRQRMQYRNPCSETGGTAFSRSYQTARADEYGGIYAGRQYGPELGDRTMVTSRPMKPSAFVLPSHRGVKSPSRCQETSSDTSTLPAVRDDHIDSRSRMIKECECRQMQQTFRPLPMKCDSSDGIPVRKSLSGSGRDKRRMMANLHITSRPASRTMSTNPRIEVKVTSSRSSQEASSMEHQVQAKIRRRLPLQSVGGDTQSLDTGLPSGQTSTTGASTSDDVCSSNTMSPSADDLDCYLSEGTPGDRPVPGQRIAPSREKAGAGSNVKKLRGRITFHCSDCRSGRPHSCKCKDAQVAIQTGKVKVIATPSGCRTTSSDKSTERSSTKSLIHTTPADRKGRPLRQKKCLENFLSDSCMDRYEPDWLKHKTKYGLASSYCDPLRLPGSKPFSHKLDCVGRRYSGHRSRSSHHIPTSRYCPYTPRVYNRPPKGDRQRHDLPRSVVATSYQSRSNSASPSPYLWMGEQEKIDPFEQIVTAQLPFTRQRAQQMHTYQKRGPIFGQINIDFEKLMTSTRSWKSKSPKQPDRLYSPSPNKITSRKRFLAKCQVPDRARAHLPRNQNNAADPSLADKTSLSARARKTPPPIDIVPHLYTGFMTKPRSVAGLLRPPFSDRADELQLRRGLERSGSPQAKGRESHCFENSGRPSPARVYQSLQRCPSNACPPPGHSTDVELWGINKNFSSSVGENKVMWSASNATPTQQVSQEVIDNLNLWDADPVPSSLSLDISQSLDIRGQDVDDVWVGGNLLEIAQFIPPLPVGEFGNQTLAMIRRNSHKAALYAKKLLTSLCSPSSPCSECEVGASSESSSTRIRYVLVAVESSSSHVSSVASSVSQFRGGQTTSVNMNSFTCGVHGSASASNHKEASPNRMSIPGDFDQLTKTSSAGAAHRENSGESVFQHLSTPPADTTMSPLSPVPDQELIDSLHGCQSLGSCVIGFSGRATGVQADPCNVTLCEAELSLEDERRLRAAIYRTLRLRGNFTLIPFCFTESSKSKSSLSQEETSRDVRWSQHLASDTDQHKRGEIASSNNNSDRHHALDALVCNQNNNKLKIYIISSEKQKQDHPAEEMPQNSSNQHSRIESLADRLHSPLDMYSTVLGNHGCTVPVLGKAYHIFTFDELIRATGKSTFGDEPNIPAETCMKGQQIRVEQNDVGKQMSGLEEENISISHSPLRENFLTPEVTIKETDDIQYMDNPSVSGHFEDVTNEVKHVYSHQYHRLMKKWSCLTPGDNCVHLLDCSASGMCPARAIPDTRLFSRNRCENINNSLASPPSNSQDEKPVECQLLPRLPQNGDSSQYDTRHFPTIQHSSSSITGVCSRYINIPSEYLESSSRDGPVPHDEWNFRRAASWSPTSDQESGVSCELSPEPEQPTDVDSTHKAVHGNLECEHDRGTRDAHQNLPPEKMADENCQQTMVSPVTDMVTPPDTVTLNSHQVEADSLRSCEEVYKEIPSDNENTCATFLSLSSECYSCLSHKSKSHSEVQTDISSLEPSHCDTTLATRDLTHSSNPLGLLQVLINGKLKVVFDKALERWVSPSLRKCSQITKGSKARTQSETLDSLSSPHQASGCSTQAKEEGQETSSEFFASVKESLSEKSITEESFVLLSILSESASASVDKEPGEAVGLNNQGQSVELAHEATNHKRKKSGPREKYVFSVKRKLIVSESRSRQNKEQESRGMKEQESRTVASQSSCNIENTWSESKREDMKSEATVAQSDEINKVDMLKAATAGLADTPESRAWTRLITSTRPSQRYRNQRAESESETRGQSLNRPVVSGGSSRKNRSVCNLRKDRARHRRRHELQVERTSKHAHTGGKRGGRQVTIEIVGSRTKVGKSGDEVRSPKSGSSSGASDADRTHASSLKSEHHSLACKDSRQDTSRGRDKSPVQSARSKAPGTHTEREDRGNESTSTTKLDSPKLGENGLSKTSRELKNWEINKDRKDRICYSCLPSQDSFRCSHSLQYQLRATAIHNNMRLNRKDEHLTRGICMQDPRPAACIHSSTLTPIQEESLSQESSTCDKSKSDQETLTNDISDTAANESHSQSKHSHTCNRSTSTHHTPSHRSISVQYSFNEGHSAAESRKSRGRQRERSGCHGLYKDSDCQTDEPKATSPDCYEDFLTYLQNRRPFKSAFLRQEMKGLGHWSTSSRATSGAKNENELLRIYAGGGTGSSYFQTGKLDLNAYWYHQMKNININWTQSDQHRSSASPQTGFSSMELPVLAVTDCTNWRSRTQQPPFLSTSIEFGGRSGDLNHRLTFLNDHLVNDAAGNLAFSHTSSQPGCRSGELKLTTRLLKHHLAGTASATRLPPRRHIHSTSHRRLTAGVTDSRLCCGHTSVREWNKSANNGNDPFFSLSSGQRDQLDFYDYHHQVCPAAKHSTTNIQPDRDATTTNIQPDRDATTTNIQPDRDATTTNIQPDRDATTTNIQPDRDATTTNIQPDRNATTNIQPDRDTTTTNIQPDIDATTTNIQPDRDATTTNIQPNNDVTTLASVSTHARRKTTRGSEHEHLKHHLMPCQKILLSVLVNLSDNSDVFHEKGKVNRLQAKHGKIYRVQAKHGKINKVQAKHGKVNRVRAKHGKVKHGKRNCPPDHYGENERKVCRIMECPKDDTKVMHCRENDERITQMTICQENEAIMIRLKYCWENDRRMCRLKYCRENDRRMCRLKYCRENDRRMCRLKNSCLKFLFNDGSLQTKQTSHCKLLTKFPTHIFSIFRICSKHTFCLLPVHIVNTHFVYFQNT
ncbi:hypothetical protein BsWGS_26417 [Bradybaena similaris]